MSWLFGVKKQPVPEMAQEGSVNTAGQASGDQQLTKAEKKAMEALERAAEAAKTLEKSSKSIN